MDNIVLVVYGGTVVLLCANGLIVPAMLVAAGGWLGLCGYAWWRARVR